MTSRNLVPGPRHQTDPLGKVPAPSLLWREFPFSLWSQTVHWRGTTTVVGGRRLGHDGATSEVRCRSPARPRWVTGPNGPDGSPEKNNGDFRGVGSFLEPGDVWPYQWPSGCLNRRGCQVRGDYRNPRRTRKGILQSLHPVPRRAPQSTPSLRRAGQLLR